MNFQKIADTSFKSYGISGQIFGLILLFSVIDRFKWIVLSLHNNIQYEFLKGPFLVLQFLYYILMTFLMLSVMLLSMLMTILSILSVIRHLICGINLNWFLKLKPI